MKILKISEDKALNLYKDASKELKEILEDSFGKEFFKPKSITDRIKTIEDVFEELGEDYNDYIPPFPKAKTKEEKSCNAQMLLFKIAKVYNEGTILDWKDSNQPKYFNYKYFSGGSCLVDSLSWNTYCSYSAGLFYKSKSLSEDSYNKFKNIYNDYYLLVKNKYLKRILVNN
jgi:hypothetical protein